MDGVNDLKDWINNPPISRGAAPFVVAFSLEEFSRSREGLDFLKAFADRARPFNLLLETKIVGWKAAGLSFPSGHTTQSFFIATVTINYFRLPLAAAVLLYAIALIVGVTRVYLGAHYPRDVMAGAILGLIWGAMGVIVAPYL